MRTVNFYTEKSRLDGQPIETNTDIAFEKSANKQRGTKGFTLIEVLIVVAIVGIIAAVGYPSYGDYVRKTRRADAQLALMNATQAMERCRTTAFSYASCTLPAGLQVSEEGNYAITVTTTTSTFTLTATAQNTQSNDADCPTLTLNDQGVQGHTGSGPCW